MLAGFLGVLVITFGLLYMVAFVAPSDEYDEAQVHDIVKDLLFKETAGSF